MYYLWLLGEEGMLVHVLLLDVLYSCIALSKVYHREIGCEVVKL